VYGSLFPFEFRERGTLGGALHYLLATPPGWTDRGDVLSNILLYIPLGLFGARALGSWSAGWRVLAMAILGVALSTGIELTQYFEMSRACELSDVTANLAGAVMGALAEAAVRGRVRRTEAFAILVLAAQAGAWLYPYVPSLDVHRYARSLRGALSLAPSDTLEIYKQIVIWLAIALLLEALAGAARARVALPVMAGFVILASFAIPGAAATGPHVAGAALAMLAWTLALSKTRARAAMVAALFAVFVIVDALRPFTFLPSPRPFGWTPFASFISGPRGHASHVFLEKTFTYGALLWLFVRSGLAWLPATLSAAALVMSLRLTQMWLPGRSAEITDVLMVVILAAVMNVLSR
jgi:VanZ family protein